MGFGLMVCLDLWLCNMVVSGAVGFGFGWIATCWGG